VNIRTSCAPTLPTSRIKMAACSAVSMHPLRRPHMPQWPRSSPPAPTRWAVTGYEGGQHGQRSKGQNTPLREAHCHAEPRDDVHQCSCCPLLHAAVVCSSIPVTPDVECSEGAGRCSCRAQEGGLQGTKGRPAAGPPSSVLNPPFLPACLAVGISPNARKHLQAVEQGEAGRHPTPQYR